MWALWGKGVINTVVDYERNRTGVRMDTIYRDFMYTAVVIQWRSNYVR